MSISPKYHVFSQLGFTLVELMIVVAIMGVLASLTIPAYSLFIDRAKDNACLGEAKAYSNQVHLAINDQDDSTAPVAPPLISCVSMTDATDWTLTTQRVITAVSKSNTSSSISCDIPNANPCKILP